MTAVAGIEEHTVDERDVAPPVRRRAADPRVNLSSNELIHPAVEQVLRSVAARLGTDHLRKYPVLADGMEVLAGYFGRRASDCVVTPGSDAAIRLICDSFARRGGGTILLQAPNYDAWEQAARLRGLSVQHFGAPEARVEQQLADMIDTAASCRHALVAVSTPNGPAGGVAPAELLDRLAEVSERHGHLFVIDACYQAFTGAHDALLPRAGGRTLVVHSLSKSHGLAGARLALVFGGWERLDELDAWPTEQTVSASSLLAALVATEHHEILSHVWAEIREVRDEAAARLRGWGATPLPSGGNFLTVRLGGAAEATGVAEGLSEAGYRIRDLSALPGLSGCIRFTIGDRTTTDAFLSVLHAVMSRRGRP